MPNCKHQHTLTRLKGEKDGERLAQAVFVPSGRSPAPVAGILHLVAGLADGAPSGAVSLNHVRAHPPTSLPGAPTFITLSVKSTEQSEEDRKRRRSK